MRYLIAVVVMLTMVGVALASEWHDIQGSDGSYQGQTFDSANGRTYVSDTSGNQIGEIVR